MAQLVNLRFRYEGSDYEISLDFDDAALVDNVVAFDVAARRVAGRKEGASATARVELDPNERSFRVLYAGGVFMFDLAYYDPETDAAAEAAIEGIPPEIAGDRILGCAIRGGVSAVVGQGIRCFQSTHEIEGGWHRFNAFVRCMAENFGRISVVALLRTFRCIATTEGS